mmetsp:Transcript_69364/g.196566  ORF Transcript_69364/g.196566 Transcript_69364/m.196566 type:complete len:164 (+) Transcript_69364:232-723(+)
MVNMGATDLNEAAYDDIWEKYQEVSTDDGISFLERVLIILAKMLSYEASDRGSADEWLEKAKQLLGEISLQGTDLDDAEDIETDIQIPTAIEMKLNDFWNQEVGDFVEQTEEELEKDNEGLEKVENIKWRIEQTRALQDQQGLKVIQPDDDIDAPVMDVGEGD